METLTSLEAAAKVGVNVQKFHRLAERYNVKHVLKAPGLRGAKFWHPIDVDRIAERLNEETAA